MGRGQAPHHHHLGHHPPDAILFSRCRNRISFVKLWRTASRQLPTLTTLLQNPGGCECDSRGNVWLSRERRRQRHRRRLGHQHHIKLSEYYTAAPGEGVGERVGGGERSGEAASWNELSGTCEAKERRETSSWKILRRLQPSSSHTVSLAAFPQPS